MDQKIAIKLATKRYLAPTVVVILVLSAGMTYVWGEYKELLKQKDQLAVARKAFFDEKVASERYRAEAAMVQLERKVELDKREFILQQLEKDAKVQFFTLQQRAAEYSDAFNKLQTAQVIVSREQRTKEAEEKMLKLMSEFSEMGVDLNEQLRCDDPIGAQRHKSAQAKFSEIYAIAEAYGLKERFRNFLFHNAGSTVYSSCKK